MGQIEFLNFVPLYWGLARTGSLLGVDLTVGSPELLSDALVAGQLDISPISLFEFLRHADDLVVLSGVAVGCDGPVMSCMIISKVPVTELDGATVALGNTSRTLIRLAQLLLAESVGVQCQYVGSAPDVAAMLRVASAAVVIGDVALRAVLEAPVRGWYVYDLGEMWRDWTGLPFVFAVVAAGRAFADREPEVVHRVHLDLLDARDLAMTEINEVCREVARWEDLDEGLLHRYYTEALDFSFGARQEDAVAEFARRIGGDTAGLTLTRLRSN